MKMEKLKIHQGDQKEKFYLGRDGMPTPVIYDSEIPAVIALLQERLVVSAAKTTNLNFWQAYQAMKRGEWVMNKNVHEGTHFAIVTDGEGREEIRHFMGYSLKVLVTTDMLNSTAWYIVPKGPRYKVGDRFVEVRQGASTDEFIREIIIVDETTKNCCVRIQHDGEHLGIHCCSYAYLDTLTKLPS